jgi:phosphate transport system substrate-binding protein
MFASKCWKPFAVVGSLLTLILGPRVATAQTLEGAGSSFIAPIFFKEFAQYKEKTGTGVNYQSIGSGAGFTAFKNKTVDFGASDVPMTQEEEGGLSSPAVQFPVIAGCVVITYNLPGIGSGLRFTPEILAGIYQGRIKNWNDPKIKAVNPGASLPGLAIQPVHRTDGSGTTFIFTNYLKKANREWAADIGSGKSVNWPVGLGGKGNEGMAAVVTRTPGAIGYNELAYAIANKLTFGSVRNRAGNFVAPSIQSTTAAVDRYVSQISKNVRTDVQDAPGVNSYPIAGLTYVFLYRNSPKADALVKLFTWWLQPGQQDEVKTLLYAPLPASLIKVDMTALKSVHH